MENQKHAFFKNIRTSVFVLAALWAPAAVSYGSVSPKIEVPAQPVVEGGAFFVNVEAPEKTKSVEAFFNNRVIEFYPDGKDRFTGFIGVEIGTKEGKNEMLVKINLGDNEIVQKKVDVDVKKGDFPQETVVVDDDKVKPRTRAEKRKIARDNAFLARMYAQSLQEKLWTTPIQMPVNNIVTAPFGTQRLYRGKKNKKVQKRGYHRGTDMRAYTGTHIMAPLAGKVVAARYLYFTGNTVILDHGFGFFSIYAHMSKLKVKEKQMVKKGVLLGLSGATGRVVAPHLHWGMKLNGALVDPMVVAGLLK